jgi:hypothetical protein
MSKRGSSSRQTGGDDDDDDGGSGGSSSEDNLDKGSFTDENNSTIPSVSFSS